MPLTCYVGNHSPKNGTSILQLEKSDDGKLRELVLGGDPLELTDDEFASLNGRFQLRQMRLNSDGDLVEDDGSSNVLNVQSTAPAASPSTPPPATPSASVSSTPTTPGSGS